MLFNSFEFALFLPLTFIIYWFLLNRSLRAQNLFIIAASYFFYGWWDWRFLGLIIISSLVDFLVGLKLHKTQAATSRKWLVALSLLVNLGFLGVFKYFNFFVDSFVDLFAGIGVQLEPRTLNIILPVGISFYTFQTLSYTLDIYRNKIEPTRDIPAFFAFVSFFPQLVAGPIERASNLLKQFTVPRKFSYAQGAEGMRLILWGLFKKIVVADNCAVYVNQIFGDQENLQGPVLALGVVYFAFQIYGDFSGYSDIAIGTARLFGFRLMTNFRYPYFSRDIGEFWRRWHISLSTWFRDYLYIPLGGSRGNQWHKIRNVILIFTVSGFWHGANWTFVVWGFLNALYFIPLLLIRKNRQFLDVAAQGKHIPSWREVIQILLTFAITCFAWIFFRAESMSDALVYILNLFSFGAPSPIPVDYFKVVPLILLMLIFEWLNREKEFGLAIENWRPVTRWLIYLVLTSGIFALGPTGTYEFIYFQF